MKLTVKEISGLTYEEDFVTSQECDSCGEIYERGFLYQSMSQFVDFEDEECECCGGSLMNTTSHESTECDCCHNSIDMWENIYRGTVKRDFESDLEDGASIYLCKSCGEEFTDLAKTRLSCLKGKYSNKQALQHHVDIVFGFAHELGDKDDDLKEDINVKLIGLDD